MEFHSTILGRVGHVAGLQLRFVLLLPFSLLCSDNTPPQPSLFTKSLYRSKPSRFWYLIGPYWKQSPRLQAMHYMMSLKRCMTFHFTIFYKQKWMYSVLFCWQQHKWRGVPVVWAYLSWNWCAVEPEQATLQSLSVWVDLCRHRHNLQTESFRHLNVRRWNVSVVPEDSPGRRSRYARRLRSNVLTFNGAGTFLKVIWM